MIDGTTPIRLEPPRRIRYLSPYSAKIKRLADEVSGLTLLETLDLTELLKQILGLGSMCVVVRRMQGREGTGLWG